MALQHWGTTPNIIDKNRRYQPTRQIIARASKNFILVQKLGKSLLLSWLEALFPVRLDWFFLFLQLNASAWKLYVGAGQK